MQINPTFSFTADATQTDVNEFESAVNAVIGFYDSVFNNNVSVNIAFGYGESFGSVSNNQIVWTRMANAGGSFALGKSQYSLNSFNYTTVRNTLLGMNNGLQAAAYATLPASSPFGNASLWMSDAQQKALGFTPTGFLAGYDGVVGIISNEELAAGGDTADWTKAAPGASNQFYMLGSIEHEISEVLGRESYDGTNAVNNAPSYTLMDMFRYSAPGVRQTTNGNPAYFSINNGNNVYYYWNNPTLASGDLGDWAASGPNNFDPTGNDAYLNNSSPGVINEVSNFDLNLMNVLGWDIAPPSPSTPPGTTADMIVQDTSGNFDIWDIGGNQNLAQFSLGTLGAGWQFGGLGDFNGADSTDMLWRDASGNMTVFDVANSQIQNTVTIATLGGGWQFGVFGDFSGNFNNSQPETDLIMHSAGDGSLLLLDIQNNRLTGLSVIGKVPAAWQFAGSGDFSSIPNETDFLMRDPNSGGVYDFDVQHNQIVGISGLAGFGNDWQIFTGDFSTNANETDILIHSASTGQMQIWDVQNNRIVGATGLGQIGTEWHVAGITDITGNLNESDLIMQDVNTGQFLGFDIRGNQIVGQTSLGSAGTNWHPLGVADPPGATTASQTAASIWHAASMFMA